MAGDATGLIEDGVLAARHGRLVYAGPADGAPAFTSDQHIDCEGRLVTPGLIDCHTHLVYAGNRADEFEKRLEGVSYEEITRNGGGIASTVTATRAASEQELMSESLPRLDALLAEGVTTLEVKSGYGLNLEAERRMLSVARALQSERKVRIATTFLGAHAVPKDFQGAADAYVDLVVSEMLPSIAEAQLADAVDGFCETIGFSTEQIRRVFEAARELGLPVKLHAEQLSDQNGSALAAEFGALSADHLEYLSESGVQAMAQSGTVATLLPGAFYATHETKLPPVEALRQHGVPMAIATDCNPGTSPLTSVLLAMNMAATLFRMTVQECLQGVTINAAKALGLQDNIGSLEAGKSCDLAIWDVRSPSDLVYRIGFNPLHARVFQGETVS
nr:imidazolonepropionase [Ponticaulis sp.]|tara:strand:- start:2904 stop:4070 length:1167 start_codon:yes stop_codon:yes gene_type:complete